MSKLRELYTERYARLSEHRVSAAITDVVDLHVALEAVIRLLDGSQPVDIPGALMVARTAANRVR